MGAAACLSTVAALAMAIGTVAQHATGSWIGMLLDHAGMQFANLAMVVVGVRRIPIDGQELRHSGSNGSSIALDGSLRTVRRNGKAAKRAAQAGNRPEFSRFAGWRWGTLLAGAGVAFAGVVLLTAAFEPLRRWFVIGGMVPGGVIELWLVGIEGRTTDHRWHGLGWVAFALAITLWVLDHDPRFCDPSAALQLHAGWHVLSAAALGCWSIYYAQFPVLRAQPE